MPTLQGKLRALIVIECRRRPSLDHVTVPAFGDSVLGDELAVMSIGMAGLAILRCSLELNVVCALHRFVTIAAAHSAVGAHKSKLRLGMIEVSDVDPRSRGVAGLATQDSAIRALERHALLELTVVGIHVASRARAVFKVERKNLVGPAGETSFVTIRAGDGRMGSGEGKARIFMFRNRES